MRLVMNRSLSGNRSCVFLVEINDHEVKYKRGKHSGNTLLKFRMDSGISNSSYGRFQAFKLRFMLPPSSRLLDPLARHSIAARISERCVQQFEPCSFSI
jgi:hypothetical protein